MSSFTFNEIIWMSSPWHKLEKTLIYSKLTYIKTKLWCYGLVIIPKITKIHLRNIYNIFSWKHCHPLTYCIMEGTQFFLMAYSIILVVTFTMFINLILLTLKYFKKLVNLILLYHRMVFRVRSRGDTGLFGDLLQWNYRNTYNFCS